MSDDAYMEAKNRDPKYIDRAFTFDIAQSHAVLDSVAQELADALREFTTAYRTHPRVFSPSTVWLDEAEEKGNEALQRFDNLNKKADTE